MKLAGLLGLGVRRVGGRLTGPTPGRTLVCILGVGVAIATLVTITGLALGLAAGTTVGGDDIDYWIVPEGEADGLSPLAYEEVQLGDVHQVTTDITADDRVRYASPVAMEPLRLEAGDEDTWVLAIGIIPPGESRTIAGMDVGTLDANYPFYSDSGYDGEWTGELVVSPTVAERLAVEQGSTLRTDDPPGGGAHNSLQVVDVADQDPTIGASESPAVVMHLAELQVLTATAEGDMADQILVDADGSDVREDLEGIYPETEVVTRGGLFELSMTPTNMPFALSLAAGLVALGIGVAFVATMVGLELTATRQTLAVLAAVGYRQRSIAVILATETVTVAALGGILGIGLGVLGIYAVNAGIASVVGLPPVATVDPILVAYGLGAAVVVGLLSVFYPLYIAWRTEPLTELTR